jgi:hypothetical protein
MATGRLFSQLDALGLRLASNLSFIIFSTEGKQGYGRD